MPRREEEAGFNSDSFLDVVANLVGILIILIVVAGVKVSRAPVALNQHSAPSTNESSSPSAALADTALPDAAPVAELPPLPAPLDQPDRYPTRLAITNPPELLATDEPEDPIPVPPLVFPPLPEVAPDAQLSRQLSQRTAELQQRQQRLDQQRNRQSEFTQRAQQLSAELAALEGQATQTTTQQSTVTREMQELDAAFAQLAQSQQAVQRELVRISNQQAPVKQLEHQLSPVGRMVEGEEIHFRLAGNRISFVPMNELVRLLKVDIERRKEIMLTRPAYQGTIGPVQGFTMDYVLQRDNLSLAEELKFGSGIMRMTVTGWILRPQPDLPSESLSEALRPDSRFHRHLLQAGRNTAITFWVYPDSFELHRELKQHTHESGFWVASRPLPEGVPIAGSPQGSKSLAQ